jgi:hypothetical protein
MSSAFSFCLLNMENPSVEYEENIYVCVVDDIVVGNFYNKRIISNGMEVIMPTWENLKKILTSPNHKFIKNNKCILVGTIWNGTEFIAPIEQNVVSIVSTDIICKKINNSCIYYDNNMWIAVKDYTMYIIDLLEDYLNKNPLLSINFFVNIKNDTDIITDNENKIIKIGINFEQTIVSDEIVAFGIEPIDKIYFNNKKYTVRIEEFYFLNKMDIVIDYSKPNIRNIEISGIYDEYVKKNKYISPAFYKNITQNTNENKNKVVTLFSDNAPSPRRLAILNELTKIDNYINKNNCYDQALIDLLDNTKLLVNIHQSDYENTFEEIRVLPALFKKVIVISEISPLTEFIPCSPLIIWTTYDKIIEKTKEVLQNYETYYNSIFNNENINLLNDLDNLNKISIEQMLQ